jgi:hypothetical protein
MGKIIIENIRNYSKSLSKVQAAYPKAHIEYCGRTMPQYSLTGGALANNAGKGITNPIEAVKAFRLALWQDFNALELGPMFKAVSRLADLAVTGRDIVLVCWCKPEPCHTEVIERAIYYRIGHDEP